MATRREILIGAAGLVLLPACSSGGGGGGMQDASGPRCASSISLNHGHVLSIQASDLTGGRDRTYNIQGSADHSHSVTITAAQFTMLMAGATVTATSTLGGGHTHDTSTQCA